MLKLNKYISYIKETSKVYEENTIPIINCSLGETPYGCSSHIHEKLKNLDYSIVANYQDPVYNFEFISALLAKWKKHNISRQNIFINNGIASVLERIVCKLFQKGKYLGIGPQFPFIIDEIKLSGGSYEIIPMTNNFEFPIDSVISKLKKEKKSVAIYINNPINPTGLHIKKEYIENIISTAEKNSICVIIDEAFGDFLDDKESAISLVHKYSNLIITRSFSKAYGLAGLRIGYTVISDSLISYFKKINLPFEPSIISTLSAMFTLKDKAFIENIRKKVFKEKEILIKHFKKIGLQILPSNMNVSIFVVHKKNTNLYDIFNSLSIKTISGIGYKNSDKRMDPSFVRFRVPGSIEKCEEIISRTNILA